jgi:flagellar biogenesis protein FliO
VTDTFQPAIAVVFVLALLAGVLYVLRRRGVAILPFESSPSGARRQGQRHLKVLERVPLGAQHALHLVRAGDRMILIATAPCSCQVLDSDIQEGVER